MAARKHGGYRGNEFRIRESVLDFKGRNFGYSKPEPRRKSDGERAVVQDLAFEKRRERCEREKPRYSENRAREEKRESRKGHRHSSSNGGNSGGIGVRKGRSRGSDIEPGELLSGSGSDGSVVLESQLEVKEVTKWDNGVELPPAKKQKLSPVVWDRENEHEKESTIANSGGVSVSKSPGFDKSSTGSSCLLDQEQHGSNDEEMREPEDEDVVRTWNISGSRWADEEEGEIFSDEDVPKRKKKSSATRSTKVSTLELEDLTSQLSEGIRENNSLHGLSKNDNMDVEKEVSNSTCPYYSDDSERENDSYGSAEPFSPPRRSVNMLQGCRSVLEFERLGRVSEGTYGVVFKARDTRNGDIVALKKVKMEKEREGFPLTALREINILLSSHHPSVVDVKEVVMGDHLDQIFMVMEYMEHDLKGYVESMKRRFTSGEVKCLMLQLLEGVKYLHDNWILHRDLKTSNLLLNNQGELKICDFGLSRQYGSPPKPYTPLVVTLWYRAPELLLNAKQYSTAIDMWSVGCIMAELLAKAPLFSGKSEVDQLDKIFKTLGTPTEKMWPSFSKLPGVKVNFVKNQKNLLREKFPSASFTGRDPVLSEAGFDLLSRLLTYNPEERITAAEAVNHEWFYEDPLPISKFDMPTVPSQHARNR